MSEFLDKKQVLKTKHNIILINQQLQTNQKASSPYSQQTQPIMVSPSQETQSINSQNSSDLNNSNNIIQQKQLNFTNNNENNPLEGNRIVMGPLEQSILKNNHFLLPSGIAQQQQQQQQKINQPSIPSNSVDRMLPFDKNENYYNRFWKMYFTNELVIAKLLEYKREIATIRQKAEDLEDLLMRLEQHEGEEGIQSHDDAESKSQLNKKKNRRCAKEISKDFKCPYDNCSKSYGSEVSMNLHIKIKHNGGNKTEREKLAREIFAAKISGEQIPQMNLNLPPGFIEEISTTTMMSRSINNQQSAVINGSLNEDHQIDKNSHDSHNPKSN